VRVYVQQELGHYVAEAVLDALAGLRSDPWGLTPADGGLTPQGSDPGVDAS
jgi:hypothetical protein